MGRIIEEGVAFAGGRLSILDTLDERHGTVHGQLVEEGRGRMVPLFSDIVESGRSEGCFDTEHPRKAVEFLFKGSDLLSDPGLAADDLEAYADFHDRVLGAETGTFSRLFRELRARLDGRMNEDLKKSDVCR